MRNNQFSRYGAISKVLPHLAPAGKSFFVLSTTPSWFGDFQNEFPNDFDGIPRVYSTIKAALANTVASRGDVIYVMPNHTENITNTTDLNVNVAGVRIVGVGQGNNRPTLTVNTATTALITVSAANCSIENMIIDGTGFDAIAKVISVTAAGFSFIGNKMILTGASAQATLGILGTASANDLTIRDNLFYGTSDAGTTAAIELVGSSNAIIEHNNFIGAYGSGVGAITNITTDCINVVVRWNTINNLTASNTKAMTFTSGTTGVISQNYMQILSGTAPITGAAMSWVGGNYYAATIATAGTLI